MDKLDENSLDRKPTSVDHSVGHTEDKSTMMTKSTKRRAAKRVSSDPGECSPQKTKQKASTIDILAKIFPKLKPTCLEETFQKCECDMLKTIEHLIKASRECEANLDTELANSTNADLSIKLPLDTAFGEIRKQLGFNKKKPKNSFVRHKANYESALREQAAKSGTTGPNLDLGNSARYSPLGSVESLSNPYDLKGVSASAQAPCPPPQQLLSMFASSGQAGSTPTGNQNGGMHSFGPICAEPSPTSSPPNLLSSCHGPISSMSSMATNLSSSSSQQQRSLLNPRSLMLNPSLMMHNPMLSGGKLEPDSKLTSHGNSFGPVTSSASSLPHLSRNLFDSLVASTGYRNLFPAFFPGSTPNLASLGLLGAGLTGMAGQNTDTPSLFSGPGLPLTNFEQNFEEFNQKLLSQRTHQLQTALHNICDNGWYGMGSDLIRNSSNGSSQSKCDDKSDSHS